MSRLTSACCAALGLALWATNTSAADDANQPRRVVVDRLIARVAGEPILWSDLLRSAGARPAQPGARARWRKQLGQSFRDLIDRRVVEKVAERDDEDVSDADLDGTVDRMARQQHMTRDELLEAIRSAGWTEAEYRRELRISLLEQRLFARYWVQSGEPPDPDTTQKVRKTWQRQLRQRVLVERYLSL